MDYHDSDVLVEDGFNYDFDEEDELVQLYATGPRGGRRLGRNGPRTEEALAPPPGDAGRRNPTSPASDGRKSPASHHSVAEKSPASPSSRTSASEDAAGRHRPRGNLPQAPSFDGSIKKNPKAFKQWLQKIDSYIEIAKHIIGPEEIGLRLHAALEGDAAAYLEGIPAKTFGVTDGWKVLVQVLKDKFAEKRMHLIGGAMKSFFQLQVDRNSTLTEVADQMDRAARLCAESDLTLPDEIMVYFFFEHSGCSFERRANILLRTGGEYNWKKVKQAVELLYPQTMVSAPRRNFDHSKGAGKRQAHEAQGQGDDAQYATSSTDLASMDLEDWLYYEDPIERLADYDTPEWMPEGLARELHEVFATHRENRAKLAKAVKARGFYTGKGKGKKGSGGKGKGKGRDSSSGSGGKSSGKKGKGSGGSGHARGMSLDELKKKTTCGDCGQLGHWRGDPACRGPNKANETVTIDLADDENPENDDLYYDDVWMEWQDWEQDANEAWTTHSGAADQSSTAYAAQAKKEQKSEHYPELTKPEAEEVIHGVNRIKKKFHSKDSPTETVTPPSKKPMDVFTASALIQHRVEAKKEKEKASAHTATAPEAVREAFDVLGIKPPDTKDSVWGVLNQEAEATFDLDEMRVVMAVTRQGPSLQELQRPHLGHDDHGQLLGVPRSVLANTRLAPSVRDGVAYLTIDTACENTVGGRGHLDYAMEILRKKRNVKALITPEEESYRFGPGEARISHQRFHIPIGIGGVAMIIKTSSLEDRHPEQNRVPWLAGQDWLRFMEAVVDVAGQKLILKAVGAQADLFIDVTGHLVVAVDDFPPDGWPQGKVKTRDHYAGALWM